MRTITGLRISAAAAGAVVALAVLPVGANAAFDTSHDAPCEGATTIAGIGASFQRQAHLAWGAEMLAPDPANAEDSGFGRATGPAGGCSVFGVGATNGKKVTFEPRGSGDGRTAVGAVKDGTGVRNTAFQFAAADEPPTAEQLKVANGGPTTATTDDAVLLTVPVAQSSVATVVKVPATCTVPALGRRLTLEALAGAFSASTSYDTWGEVLPDIKGADDAGTTACKAKPVKRVVRLDSSGTTFAFKNYLASIDPVYAGLGNTAWPNDTGATVVVKGDSNGAGALLDKLNAQTDGGIGYADLAASRARNFDSDVLPSTITPPGGGAPVPNPDAGKPDPADPTFWVSVQNKDRKYLSPALNDAKNTPNTGANCRNVSYQNGTSTTLPAVTESWINVNANATTTDYPLCALTYELVWQDMAKVNANIAAGVTPYSQDQARSVKDYLGYILNVNATGGQGALAPVGYQGLPTVDAASGAPVPSSLLDIAQAAQRSLTWNGATIITPPPGDGGGTDQPPVTTPPVTTPPVTTPPVTAPPVTTPPVTTPPNNTKPKPTTPTPAAKVTVSKAVGAKGRKLVLTVSPSAAGKLAVSATTVSGKKKVTIAKSTLTVKKRGKVVLTITPSSAGKRALKPGKTVKVTFKVTFTAKTGKKSTVTKTVKVKIKR